MTEAKVAKPKESLCHGYKSTFCVTCRKSIYQSSNIEKLPLRFALTDEENIPRLVDTFLSVNVGVEIPKVSDMLHNDSEFLALLSKIVKKFKRINLKVLLEKYCPKSETNEPLNVECVYAFMNAIVLKSEISSLFGGKRHIKHIQKTLKMFLSKSISTKMTVGEMMFKFPVSSVWWIQKHPAPVRVNICAKVLCWLVRYFFRKILQSFFHCTDSTHRKYQTFFYRKSSWQAVTDKALDCLLRQDKLLVLSSKSKQRVHSNQAAPVMARMRFIPKSNLSDVRMIARSEGAKTLDKSLINLLQSYCQLFQAKSDLSGNILCEQWEKLVLDLDQDRKLFWVTADISDAFGSIRLSKLCQILDECHNRLQADSEGLMKEMKEAKEMKETKERLKRRLLLHTVMFNSAGRRKTMVVRKGVLQGDPLSSLLSDIYYGHLVTTELAQFLTPQPGTTEIFLRGADDFLFVSSEKSRISDFHQMISNGFKNYKCKFNLVKTSTNLHTEDQRSEARFLGAVLDISRREIFPNYSTYANTNLYFLQGWPKPGIKPKDFIYRRFLTFCRIRQTRLFYGSYNSRKRLITTLAANISLALRRLTCMLDTLVWSRGRRPGDLWLWRLLLAGLRKFRPVAVKAGLSEATVEWTGLSCLHLELRRSSQYSARLRNNLQAARKRFNISDGKKKDFEDIISSAHQIIDFKSIQAKNGYKTIRVSWPD